MGTNNSTKHINEVLNKDIATSITIPTVAELQRKISIDDQTCYITADPFTANPFQLLGQVIEVRKQNGVCPEKLNSANFSKDFIYTFPVTGFEIDAESKLKKPELRSSIIVNKDLSQKVGFLSYLSEQLDANSSFSLMVFDQAKGLVNFQNSKWTAGINKWIRAHKEIYYDPDICYLFVISGFVQKNIIRKKYVKFQIGAKGGAYGININGELSQSTEDYSLDIIFGLTPMVIKSPTRPPIPPDLINKSEEPSKTEAKEITKIASKFLSNPDLKLSFTKPETKMNLNLDYVPTKSELDFFVSATGSTFSLNEMISNNFESIL